MLDKVSAAEIFFTCDEYAGYHQVCIWEGDILKTIFTTFYGTFVWLCMPFGLCNAGGTFQRIQNKIFMPYLDKFIRMYLDDFYMYGQ
jgi:hypothetical protein